MQRLRIHRANARDRRELWWAWLSFATLLICWDRTARLDDFTSPPRVRLSHALDQEGGERKLLAAND